MATVKELKQQAMELGIKVNGKITKQQLMEAIEMKQREAQANQLREEIVALMKQRYDITQLIAVKNKQLYDLTGTMVSMRDVVNQLKGGDVQASASEPEASEREQSTTSYDDEVDAFFVPSDEDAPPAEYDGGSVFVDNDNGEASNMSENVKEESKVKKLIEFVSADNVKVVYRINGKEVTDTVIVGWSKKDFRMHMYSSMRGDRIVSYATLIALFKKYKNGEHGDIARIVNAFKRIRKMPAVIKVTQQKAKLAQQGVVAEPRKENAQTSNRRRGTVDPEWLQQFTASFAAEYDRKPSGLEIRDAWLAYNSEKLEA